MEMEQILEPKTQLLVALAAAVAGKCQTCFNKLYGLREDAGVTDEELRSVVAIATKVATKSTGYMAEFVEEASGGIARRRADPKQAGEGEGACGCS